MKTQPIGSSTVSPVLCSSVELFVARSCARVPPGTHNLQYIAAARHQPGMAYGLSCNASKNALALPGWVTQQAGLSAFGVRSGPGRPTGTLSKSSSGQFELPQKTAATAMG